ncbi:histidine phosphatase family protein [Patescibacteria group bacterium]|nr:MAG: histidine phosphatase family protein [Patescibacteria group bacterium]
MSWPRNLVLVRHAESEGNVRSVEERAHYEVPTHDYALTERGIRQAEVTGGFVRENFAVEEAVRYVSYYRRSKETMGRVCSGLKAYEDPRLAEGQRGIWHTMTEEDIARQYPGEVERKRREGLYHYRAPGGENWPDIELRIHSFLGTLSRDYEDRTVVIVCHGHWLILLQRLIHHFSIEEAVRRYREGVFENASVTLYRGEAVGGKPALRLEYENKVPWQGKIN